MALKSELIDVKTKLEASENKAKDLEFKANEAAREVVKHHTKLQEILNKKNDEIKLFKSSIKMLLQKLRKWIVN